MKYGELIGNGLFSKVYRKGNDPFVTVVSRDPAKEAFSFDWHTPHHLIPEITAIDNDVYTMPFYPRVLSPKKQLTPHSYSFYTYLRKMTRTGFSRITRETSYDILYRLFNGIPVEFKKEKIVLHDMLRVLSNFGDDMIFEISPRNISCTKSGDLILRDCWFFLSRII